MEDGDAIAQRLNGVTPLLEPDILKNARRCELENQPMASENGTNRDSCCSSASSSSSNASASASPPPSKNGESTFKTPSAPSRRPNGPLKKRADGAPDSETPANPEQHPGDANAKTSEDPETRPEVPATTSDAIDAAAEKSAESQKEAEPAAVLPTSVCPNTHKCFTERYPNLPAKSLSDPKVDLLDEMVVDDYSLILFNSYTDYKIFKVHEDEVLERERQEERQRQVEEAARIAKLKKKGRKSKAQLEKAQRIARRTERRERRERERVERREVRRRERQEKKSRGEPLIKPDKQERQARRERREQRIRERQERQREKRERHEREREARRQQQKLQKPILAHPAAVGSQPLGAAHASAIGISDLAQHRQRFEQLYHMRKPATPATSNMEELVAAAAVLAAANHAENPNQNGRLPTVRVTLDPHPPTSSAVHKAATNENAISDSSRSDSSVLKRPGAVTAGVKRPLSELDQQQQNGPQGKLMKYEDLHNEYKKMLFNQSPQQSRRNSLQPQQPMGLGQLNYPFLGGLPPTADPSFRFAVPQHQIPMGLQRAAAAQQLGQLPPGVSAAAMADMLQHPFSPLTSMMNAVNANNAKTTAASSAAQSSMPGQTTSGVQPKAEVPNPLDFTPHHVFANNPDFASTLQQALSAMNAVDPGLLGVNAPLLGMGLPGQIPGLPLMGPNGLVNPLTEAHRQLEAIQLQHQKALAQQLAAQQKPSASNTPKHMVQQGRNISGGNPPSKTPQSTSATPSRKTSKVSARPPPSQSRCSTAAGTSSQPPPAADAQLLINSLVGKHPSPALVRHPQMALNAAGIQQAGRPGAEVAQPPTVPLSRPITPSFASSIGIQFPPGTALASQLAGAAMLGGKASFSSRNPTSSRWNRLHVDVAETLQQVFAESPEMDDGSREGQSCPPFPRDYRLVPATSAQVGGRVNPAENPNGSARPQESSGGSRQPSGSGQDASRPSTSKHERPRSRSHSPAEKKPKLSRTEQPEGGRSSNRPSGHDTPSSQPSTVNSASAAMAAVAGAIERQQKLQAGSHDPTAAQLGNQLAAGQGAPFSVADVTNLSASDAFLRQQLLASSAGAGMNQEAAKPAGQSGSDSRMQPPPQSAVGPNRPGTGPGARFSSQTPAPAASSASQSSSVAMHAAAALHPALGAIGLPQQEQLRQQQLQQAAKLHPMARALLPNNLPANSMTPDGANMMNFLYQQHQQAQRQQKTQQEQEAETMRQLQMMEKEMQKKTEMAMRQKEEESQRARQQAQQRSQLSAAQQQRPGPSNQQQQQQQQAQLAQQQQLQLQQQQQFLAALAGMPMQAAASGAGGQPLVPPNYLQNLPAATQFMLQQMMPGQQQPGASTAAQTAGLPANFLEALVAQSAAGQGQQAAQVSAAQSQATNLALQQQQAALRQAQQRLNPQSSAPNFTANFPPPAAAQPSLTHGTAGNAAAASNAARPGVDQNQLYALSLLQNQAHALDAQAREATASVQAAQNPFGQLNANAMNNPEAFRQLQQNMLERSMNPALYAQLLQAQQQHQQQQQQSQLQMQLVQQLQQQHQMQQRGIAPINPNQLASLVGGMPSMMEAELLMRQMSGQQLPSNLQRTAQDRDQIVEQHRLFQQQLMAAANTANDPTAAGTSVLPPGMYNASPAQLAAQLRNGAAGPMGNLGQKK